MADALKNAGNGVDRKFIKDKLALTNSFTGAYMGAFSATNMFVTVRFPYEDGPVPIGSLAALSISTHRDVFPVTNMYNVNPRGFTQGHRTTAGTMIFHTIDRNAFFFDRRQPNGLRHREAINGLDHRGLPHPDTLPLFDVQITYINEEGMVSSEGLFGVRLLDFGKTMSFENLHPMESYSFMALEYEPMRVLVSGNSLEVEKQYLLSKPSTRQPIPTRVFGPPVPKITYIDPDIIKLNQNIG